MKHGEFKNLLVQHGWQDRWWISIDGELNPQVVSLDSAFNQKSQNPDLAILLINEAENRDTSLWQLVEIDPPPVVATPAPVQPAAAQQPQLNLSPGTQRSTPSPFSMQNIAAAHKQISLGIMLLLVSWGIKQLLTSFAILGLGGSLSQPALQAKISAKSASEASEMQTELRELMESGSSDQGKMRKLQNDISESKKKIREKYQDDLHKASVKSAKGTSTAIGATRNFFRWKLLLDLIKISALVLLVLGALKLVRDDEASLPNRALGISLTIVVVFTLLVSGLLAMLS